MADREEFEDRVRQKLESFDARIEELRPKSMLAGNTAGIESLKTKTTQLQERLESLQHEELAKSARDEIEKEVDELQASIKQFSKELAQA